MVYALPYEQFHPVSDIAICGEPVGARTPKVVYLDALVLFYEEIASLRPQAESEYQQSQRLFPGVVPR
jgi:hypothetical protein